MRLHRHLLMLCLGAALQGTAWGQPTDIIRALFVYTAAVDAAVTTQGQNVLDVVDLAVTSFNESCVNSQAGSVAVQTVAVIRDDNYVEQCHGLSTDLYRFSGNGDGYLDGVHALRDQYRADLCFLMVSCPGDPDACGRGYLFSNASSAFAVGYWDLLHTFRVYAHEHGHNIGMHHDTLNGRNSYYADGHGYLPPDKEWFTVMAYPGKDSTYYIRHWSNPNVTYSDGQVTGSSAYANNARVLLDRINDLPRNPPDSSSSPWGEGSPELFRTTPASMSLQSQTIGPGVSGDLHLAHAIATTSVTIGDGFAVNEGGRFTVTVDAGAVPKQRDIRAPQTRVAACVTEPRLSGARLSRRELMATCVLPPGVQEICMRLTDAAGRTVATWRMGERLAGFNRLILPCRALSPGMYYLQLEAKGYHTIGRVVLHR